VGQVRHHALVEGGLEEPLDVYVLEGRLLDLGTGARIRECVRSVSSDAKCFINA